MNQAVRQLLIVLLAPLCVLALVARAQEATPPPASVAPVPTKQEAAVVQPKDDSAKTNDTTPTAAEAPATAKDETASAAKETPAVKDESSAANSAPAPAPAAPAAAEAPPATQAAPVTPEPVKPAEATLVAAAPAPAPDVTPVAASVTPPTATTAAMTETVAPAVTETPAPVPSAPQAAPVTAEVAPAPSPNPATPEAASAPVASEPVKQAQEMVAQIPPAAPAPAPEAPAAAPAKDVAPVVEAVPAPPTIPTPVAETVALAVKETSAPSTETTAVAAAPVPAAAMPEVALAPAAAEPVKPTQETVAQIPPVAAETVVTTQAAPVTPEPVKPAQETVAQVSPAAPAPAKDVAPVVEAVPAPAVVTPVAETIAPAVKETLAPSSETTAVSAPTPAASEPMKPAASPEATAVAAATAPAPDVAPVASTVTPPAAAPVAEATAPEPVKPAQETVAAVPPAAEAASSPAPAATEAAVDTAAPVAAANSGVAVDHFEFSYGLAHPALPPLTQLQSLNIKTTRDGNVFRGPSAGKEESLSLGGIPEGSRFDADALRSVAQEVVRWYNSRGLYGVWVAFNSELEASNTGIVDARQPGDRSARLVIWASQISEVRTLARGKRIKSQLSINNKKHRRIINGSPLKKGKSEDQPGSLFNQEVLNDYLYGLSLHPGRRVEASIASAGQPGKVVLDYLVNESKAWQLFSQFNNFGTKTTGEFRGRVGYQDNQLTNHDDILNIDVISTTDLKTYGSFLSYRFPLWRPDKLLMRVYASYGDFAAIPSDPNLISSTLHYTGKNWQGGIEFTNRLTLWRDWQLVSILGANYNHYSFNQLYGSSPSSQASSDFLVPFVGATLSKDNVWWAVYGGLRFDSTVGNYANPDLTKGYPAMGRPDADANWTYARWNINGTAFLDHWFQHNAQPLALAHEFSVHLKGRQLLRGKRVIPQEQEHLGGALTVRGYAESVLSADEFITASIEYTYHIPRGWKSTEPGMLFRRPFKWHPTKAGQNPDWDLAVRTFFDYGFRGVNPPPDTTATTGTTDPTTKSELAFADTNFNLAGRGFGVSLAVKQNFSLRCDFGMALTELRDKSRATEQEQIISPKGNKQVYIVSTFIW